MADDPKKTSYEASEASNAPALPAQITLNASYAWFGKSGFMQRTKGDIIVDESEIAYLAGVGANFTAA